MRHQPHHVAALAANAGDVAQRAVGIVQVPEHDTVLCFQCVQSALIGEVTSLAVSYRRLDQLSGRGDTGERSISGFHAESNRTAYEAQVAVAQERAGKQAALD